MNRPKILGGLALASMMLVVLTGCPSIIANVVGASESVDQAVKDAQSGDTVKVQGSHDEDVTVDKDNVTITGENGASIGSTTVESDNVTIENITITGKLDTTPGSFQNLTLNNVTVKGWNNANLSGTFTCTRVVQPSGNASDIQNAIDNSSAGANVCVASGTYTGQSVVTIDKALTLQGFGRGTSRPELEVDLVGTTFNGNNVQPAVVVDDADNVTIDSFIIRHSTNAFDPRGVFVTVDSSSGNGSGDNFTLRNSLIEDIVGDGDGSRARGVGITAQAIAGNNPSRDTIQNPTIVNNTFRNIAAMDPNTNDPESKSLGVSLNGDIPGAEIRNNSFKGMGGPSTNKSRGIGLTEDASPVGPTGFTITENTFNDIEANLTDNGLETSAALFVGDYNTLGNHSFQQNNVLDGRVDRCCGGSPDDALLATNNWWGDASGPSGDTNEPDFAKDPQEGTLADGSGAPIVPRGPQDSDEANVRFDPWADSSF